MQEGGSENLKYVVTFITLMPIKLFKGSLKLPYLLQLACFTLYVYHWVCKMIYSPIKGRSKVSATMTSHAPLLPSISQFPSHTAKETKSFFCWVKLLYCPWFLTLGGNVAYSCFSGQNLSVIMLGVMDRFYDNLFHETEAPFNLAQNMAGNNSKILWCLAHGHSEL